MGSNTSKPANGTAVHIQKDDSDGVAGCDPRSPTPEIVRTPLQVSIKVYPIPLRKKLSHILLSPIKSRYINISHDCCLVKITYKLEELSQPDKL